MTLSSRLCPLVAFALMVPAAALAQDAPATPAPGPAPAAAEEPAPAATGTDQEALPAGQSAIEAPAAAPAPTPEATPAPAAAPAKPAEAPPPAKRRFGALAVFGVGSLALSTFAFILAGASILAPIPVSSNFAFIEPDNNGIPIPGGQSLSPFLVLATVMLASGVALGALGASLLGLEWYFNL